MHTALSDIFGFRSFRPHQGKIVQAIATPYISMYNNHTMSTLQINLPEPLQQFVGEQIVELGFDRPDQYFERLLEANFAKGFDNFISG
jgi:hypothetical protein